MTWPTWVPARADQIERGGVAGRRGGGHVHGGQGAVRLQTCRQLGGQALPGRLHRVSRERGAAEVGFQAAPVAAGTGPAVGYGLMWPMSPALPVCAAVDPAADARCRSRYRCRS
ncbi:hypothetical protein GCM10017687_87750 [Streptomyces echinatus]